MNEFQIIETFFRPDETANKDGICVDSGDDAAVLTVPENHELVVSMDTLVSGVHFPEDASAEDIAFKALAVNLSDMAAMAALPCWFTLSLTLPEKDISWIERFSSSLNQIASIHKVSLIGGDLSRGPLSITIQMHGLVPKGKALLRKGAKVGDQIYVTGQLGAAAYALKNRIRDAGAKARDEEIRRLNRPEPRVETGLALRDLAHSCIDISDGLFADLGHILKASNLGAKINLKDIPYAESLQKLDKKTAVELALTGGDDYELCFTLPAQINSVALNKLQKICPVSCIGVITESKSRIRLIDNDGEDFQLSTNAYRHFD